MTKLSPLQVNLLGIIDDLYKYAYVNHFNFSEGFIEWDIGWWYRRRGKPFTRAQHAANSRAIRRLEKRGLIECKRGMGGSNRSHALRLTDAGWEAVNNFKGLGSEAVKNT